MRAPWVGIALVGAAACAARAAPPSTTVANSEPAAATPALTLLECSAMFDHVIAGAWPAES